MILHDEAETRALAGAILPWLRPGDCLLLDGPVGAGKSAFARALIQAQMALDGRIEDVPSPTFTLVQTYDTGIGEIWHADLYRLASPDEVVELGLDAAMAQAITLIEWPDRLGTELPPRHLRLRFDPMDDADARRLTPKHAGPGWDWLAAVI